MVQLPFSPTPSPTPMQNVQPTSATTNGQGIVHRNMSNPTFVKSKVQQPSTVNRIHANPGVTNMRTTSATTASSTSTQLPTPLARSMASTARGGPRPPPPPASLAQTPPFLTKLYNLVEDSGTTELVSWTEDATAFTVHKPDEFGRDVLPRYFKHNNFSSFVRQLNQYGFHKRDPDRWTFGHVNFRRGRLDLLRLISRRRPKSSSSSATPTATPVELSVQPPQAVIELGNYGLAGKLQALQRDKEVLVKELVITRKAEQALQEKCEGLENRLGMLEDTTKQMQNFILHYFSKVLQPYSDELASRKRKRLPPAAPNSFDLISPATNIAGASASAAMTSAAAGLPPPTGSSLEALRHMMQQMQMSQPNVQPNSSTARRPPVEMEPAIIHELMQDEVMSSSNSVDVIMSGSTESQPNGQSATSPSVPSKIVSSSPPLIPSSSPLPQISSPESSIWLKPIEALKIVQGGSSTTSSTVNGNQQQQQTKTELGLDDVIVNGSEFEPIGSVSPLWANEHDQTKEENKQTAKEPIDEFMNLEDDLDLLPPLTTLQIQEFGDTAANDASS